MHRVKQIRCALFVLAILTTGLGCASKNVNPAAARANTGYVDFYDTNDTEVSWKIDRVKSNGAEKKVFFEFDPIEGNTLRVALKPGRYQLSVIIVNYTILGPSMAEVEVNDGMVTPVRVVLVDNGTGQVSKKETRIGGTAYGRYGRRTKFTSSETQLFRVQTEPGAPLPYQPKSQMPYADAGTP